MLSLAEIELWKQNLPDDIIKMFSDESDGDADDLLMQRQDYRSVVRAISEDSPEKVVFFFRNNKDLAAKMGAARRMRLLSWIAARTYPQSVILRRYLNGDGEYDDGDGSSSSGSRGAFLSDLLGFTSLLSDRLAVFMSKHDASLQAIEARSMDAYQDTGFNIGANGG